MPPPSQRYPDAVLFEMVPPFIVKAVPCSSVGNSSITATPPPAPPYAQLPVMVPLFKTNSAEYFTKTAPVGVDFGVYERLSLLLRVPLFIVKRAFAALLEAVR